MAFDRLAHDALGPAESVHLGGVDQVDSQIQRAMHDLPRLIARVVLAVSPLGRPELPGAQPDRGHARAAGSDEFHESPFSNRSYTICDHDSISR